MHESHDVVADFGNVEAEKDEMLEGKHTIEEAMSMSFIFTISCG